jgi:hypothetical protein
MFKSKEATSTKEFTRMYDLVYGHLGLCYAVMLYCLFIALSGHCLFVEGDYAFVVPYRYCQHLKTM